MSASTPERATGRSMVPSRSGLADPPAGSHAVGPGARVPKDATEESVH
jgi:hypothetical protein